MVKDHTDMREETHCRHMGYSFRLTARVLLYAPSHRQDCTYHSLCYTSRGALAETRNSFEEGRKEMFYLIMHLTHFFLQLYGIRHMVKDHSDSKRKPTAATNWATLSINSKSLFVHHPSDRIVHTMTIVTPVVKHWLE